MVGKYRNGSGKDWKGTLPWCWRNLKLLIVLICFNGYGEEFLAAQQSPQSPLLSGLMTTLRVLAMNVERRWCTTSSQNLSWAPLSSFLLADQMKMTLVEALSDQRKPHQLGFLDECMEQSHLANPKPLSTVRWTKNKFKIWTSHIHRVVADQHNQLSWFTTYSMTAMELWWQKIESIRWRDEKMVHNINQWGQTLFSWISTGKGKRSNE